MQLGIGHGIPWWVKSRIWVFVVFSQLLQEHFNNCRIVRKKVRRFSRVHINADIKIFLSVEENSKNLLEKPYRRVWIGKRSFFTVLPGLIETIAARVTGHKFPIDAVDFRYYSGVNTKVAKQGCSLRSNSFYLVLKKLLGYGAKLGTGSNRTYSRSIFSFSGFTLCWNSHLDRAVKEFAKTDFNRKVPDRKKRP